jgi:hypothetical protein
VIGYLGHGVLTFSEITAIEDHLVLNRRAIFWGWLVDTVLQFAVVGIILSIVTGLIFRMYLPDTENPEQLRDVTERVTNSLSFRILDMVTVLLPSLIGGYVAAQIAATLEVKHALVVGLLSFLTAALIYLTLQLFGLANADGRWADLMFFVLFVPSAMFGGYLRLVFAKKFS